MKEISFPYTGRCYLPVDPGAVPYRIIQCECGRRYVVRAGDGLTTPPRLYWHRVRRPHLRHYGKKHA